MIDFIHVFTCILNVAGVEVQGAKELYSKEFYPHLGYLGKLPEEMIYKAETERMKQAKSVKMEASWVELLRKQCGTWS